MVSGPLTISLASVPSGEGRGLQLVTLKFSFPPVLLCKLYSTWTGLGEVGLGKIFTCKVTLNKNPGLAQLSSVTSVKVTL